jgi:hypothetical protein
MLFSILTPKSDPTYFISLYYQAGDSQVSVGSDTGVKESRAGVATKICLHYTSKECHKTESFQNHTVTAHKERERLGDRRNVGESSGNSGDGPGQMAQPLMFIMIMMIIVSLRPTGPPPKNFRIGLFSKSNFWQLDFLSLLIIRFIGNFISVIIR